MSEAVQGLLSRDEIEFFSSKGFLIIRDFYNRNQTIGSIQDTIRMMIRQVARRHGLLHVIQIAEEDLFDAGFNELITIDRRHGSEVYDLVKQAPGLFNLIGDHRHERIFRDLRTDSIPAVAGGGYGIRIDNPAEDQFRAQWHQEYPAQLRSLNGLVFWTPLIEMTPTLGPVQLAPGSHTEGPLPVRVMGGESGRSGAYSIMLANEEEILSRYSIEAPLLSPGDLLVMDFLLLHASGVNSDRRSRWSIQFRYFDLDEPIGMKNGWVGSFATGVDFSDVHPELLVSVEDGRF